MICQRCHIRPATIHFTKIVEGQKVQLYYCEECAQEQGEIVLIGNEYSSSLDNLLTSLLNFDPFFQKAKQQQPQEAVLRCSHCKLTFQKFLEVGKFGCSHCYTSFKKELPPILKRVHSGNEIHHGKVPKRLGGSINIKRQIHDLREQMQLCIKEEAFEEAANIRDTIRKLEKELKGERGDDHHDN